MKKLTVLCFLFLSLRASAIEGSRVMYVGGTVPDVRAGSFGNLDLTSGTVLTFEHSGRHLEIPYEAIRSFDYSQPVAHHLGVLPAIAIGLVKARRHRHLFRITYSGDGVAQVAIFEVPKGMAPVVQAVLQTRAALPGQRSRASRR